MLLMYEFTVLKVSETECDWSWTAITQDHQSLKTHYDNTIGGLEKAKPKEHITNIGLRWNCSEKFQCSPQSTKY